jgi:SnoaL-like domain
MTLDQDRLRDFARSYTEAWCEHDPERVAAHYVRGGTIAINGGEPTEITDVARSFISAFPDIRVFMDDLFVDDATVQYQWTFTGTSSETGKQVRIAGVEEWTLGADGLVASSRGSYDQDEYDRQLAYGASEP